jgi:xanthine/uracil permease
VLRIILGAIVGFIVWSVLWVGSDFILMAISPDWYGRHHTALAAAVENKTAFMSDSTILIIALIRSVVFSIISGYIAALIAGENKKQLCCSGFCCWRSAFLRSRFTGITRRSGITLRFCFCSFP